MYTSKNGPPVGNEAEGVTVTMLVWVLITLAALKLILPAPVASRPVLVLLFVQKKDALAGVPLKLMLTLKPGQTSTSTGSSMVGAGFTVMVKLTGEPVQLPTTGVAVMVQTGFVEERTTQTPWAKFLSPAPASPSRKPTSHGFGFAA